MLSHASSDGEVIYDWENGLASGGRSRPYNYCRYARMIGIAVGVTRPKPREAHGHLFAIFPHSTGVSFLVSFPPP